MTTTTFRFALLASLGIVGAVACGPGSTEPSAAPALLETLPRSLSATEQQVITANNDFTLRLLRRVANPDSNVVVSPLSATMALAMVHNGAVGTPAENLREVLGLSGLTKDQINTGYRGLIDLLRGLDSRTTMQVANAVWADDQVTVNPTFRSAVLSAFDAPTRVGDFQSSATVDSINAWVRAKTDGRIDRIVDRFAPEEVLVALNAILFKGRWRQAFDRADTRPAVFSGRRGDVAVPTMHGDVEIAMSSTPQFTIADLLYGNGAFAFTVILPRDNSRAALQTALDSLSPASLDLIARSAPRRELPVALPRFSLEWNRKLNDDLEALGLTGIFMGGLDSLFSGPVGGIPYLSAVQQKATITVDEQGTVAAAVTSVTVGLTSMPQGLIVNRPFVFLIRERLSGTIVFAGQVVHLQ